MAKLNESDEIACATTTRALVDFLRSIKDPGIVPILDVILSQMAKVPLDPDKSETIAFRLAPEIHGMIDKFPKVIRVMIITLMLKYELENFPNEAINELEKTYTTTFEKHKLV